MDFVVIPVSVPLAHVEGTTIVKVLWYLPYKFLDILVDS